MDRKIPNLMIAGGSKCGTTSMRAWLNQHPDIWMQIPIELNYFCKGETEMHIKNLTKKEYMRYFRKAGNQKYIGEKSNFSLYAPSAPKKIKKFNPSIKIIIMIRNPINTMRSMHFMLSNSTWYTQEDEMNFEKALEKEPERKKKSNLIFERYFYRDLVKFHKYIKRYYDTFGKKNVKVVLLDDIKQDPDKVYRDILKFLGLKYHKINFEVHNKSKVSRSKIYPKIMKAIPTPFKKITRGFLPHKTYIFLKDISTKQKEKTPISPELSKKLKKELKPEIKKLERLIGRDLSNWYT
jgi:hypothetical protein